MEQDDVVNRLKGLGRGATPPPPDFTQPIPAVRAARSGGLKFGMGPIAAVVGVVALGTAALAVPEGAPLRQVVAGLSTEVQADPADVEAEVDGDDSGVSGSLAASPCEGPPPVPTTVVETPEGAEAGASVEVTPEDRAAQVAAWQEWRSENCGPEANETDDDADESEEPGKNGEKGNRGEKSERRSGEGGPPASHPHDGDPCKGPPPHSNRPGNGDADRTADERQAEQEAWRQWHHENCPPGQTGAHPGNGQGRPDDAGRSEGAGRRDGAGRPDDAGRPDGAGRPEAAEDDAS